MLKLHLSTLKIINGLVIQSFFLFGKIHKPVELAVIKSKKNLLFVFFRNLYERL
jgi:hypothetical protein